MAGGQAWRHFASQQSLKIPLHATPGPHKSVIWLNLSTEAEPCNSVLTSSHCCEALGPSGVSSQQEREPAPAAQSIPESQAEGSCTRVCLGSRHPLTRPGVRFGSVTVASPSSCEPWFSQLSNGDMMVSTVIRGHMDIAWPGWR